MGEHKERTGKTRVGKFLQGVKGVAPSILELAGTVTGVSALKDLAGQIKGSTEISPADKETALQLLEFDLKEAEEITKRWQSDMTSDSWLSKNVRPMALIFLTIFMTLIMTSDSIEAFSFEVKTGYIDLLEALLIVVYFAYFGSRGYEKAQKIKKS